MREIKKLDLSFGNNLAKLKKFFEENGILPEISGEVAVLEDDGEIIGASMRRGSLLYGFAVKESLRGEGVLDTLLSFWIKETFAELDTIFVFTKSEYSEKFQSAGFEELAKTKKSAFLLRSIKSIKEMYDNPKEKSGLSGAIVMHANPFTLGHLFLIEEAKKEVDYLYIFLLDNDEKLAYKIRHEMIKRSLDTENCEIIKGGSLVISRETFPSYFLKEEQLIDEEHARIDALVFKNYVAKIFNIKKRFLGTERRDISTKIYNDILIQTLPPEIEVKIFERFKSHGEEISASSARKAFLNNDSELLKKFLPKGTLSVIEENEEEVRKCWMS